MIRRASLIAVELVAGLLVVAVIVFALLFWRLSAGPISLDFATPYIERALSVEQPQIDVRVQDTELVWAGWDRAFNIRARNAAVLGAGGKALAILPDVSIGFSVAAMMRGLIAPKRLEVHGLSATIERGEDGALVLGFYAGKDEAADRDFVRQLPGYLSQLTAPRDPSSPLGYLRSVSITDVDLQFIDRPRNASWRAPDTDISLLREDSGLELVASMALAFEDRSTQLTAHAIFAPDRPSVDLAFDFRNLVPADFARRLPELARLAPVETPVSGQFRLLAQQGDTINSVAFDLRSGDGRIAGNLIVDAAGAYDLTATMSKVSASMVAAVFPDIQRHARLDAPIDATLSGRFGSQGALQHGELQASAGPGTIEVIGRLAEPLAFERLRFKASIDDGFAAARISEAEIDFGEATVAAEASAYRLGETYRAQLDARVRNVQMAKLASYWPAGLGVEAREWTTENIRKGTVDEGTVAVVFQVTALNPLELDAQSVAGTLRFRDLEVSYLGELPKVTGVAGTASFTHDRFSLDLTRGQLKDVKVDHGVVNMTRLDTDSEEIAIDLVLRGPLATALGVVDSKPLALVSDLGLDPANTGGTMALRLGLRFPLRGDVRTDQIDISAAANLRGVHVSPGPFDLDLTDGSLDLKLSRAAMKIEGSARLNGVPLTLDWHEEFDDATPLRSRYILSGRLTQESLTRLRLPETGIINGAAEVDVIVTRFADGRSEILAGGDLKAAVVALPQLNWRKPVGQPGTVSLAVMLGADGRPSIDRLEVTADGLKLDASIAFDGGTLDRWRAQFRRFVVDGSDLRGRLRRTETGYALALEGGRLDLEPFLIGAGREEREIPETAESRLPPLELDARLDELRLGPDGSFRNVKAGARYDGGTWQLVDLEADLGAGKTFRTRYAPDGSGFQLDIKSDDAGAALRSLGWSERLQGGLLTVSGRRTAPGAPLTGGFKLSDYKLTQAPILARLLQVASLTGIFDALGQSGLDFVSFDGSFTYRDGWLTIERGRTFGSSLGITVEGALDLEEDIAELTGTVVPAYTVNRVLGKIPLLGRLLTGGENEGVFAATYAVNGPLEDPVVAVNPLSALAPGFLRKLFDVIGRDDSEAAPPPAMPPIQ